VSSVAGADATAATDGDPGASCNGDATGPGDACGLMTNGEVMSHSRICWSVSRRSITSAWFIACIVW